MTIDSSQIEVKHNTEQHRFEVVIDGKEAFTVYMKGEKLMTFVHTEVPEEFEGQGIGGRTFRLGEQFRPRRRDKKLTAHKVF